ncbi:unnamed protein product [Rhizophagus irregularis]|nr:unnamed protein product [Rhizophagus irregularis]
MISNCNQITLFFKCSHIVGKLLTNAITTLQIVGGGLKIYCETRWTSIYKAVSSMSRLRMALEHVLKNNPNEITNKSPIKIAITLLESANANLADCFLQLILIANTIKKLPSRGIVEFHQHCIESFNKYWDKFDPKIYILAYFLHPAYRTHGLKAVYWKTITTITAQIWQNNGGDRRSSNRLLAQMRNYELQKSPYNQEFDSHLETPMRLLKVEAMAKIRSFYVSNIKNELAYVGQQYTEDEVHEIINDSTFLQFEEKEVEIDNRRNIPISEIPNHETSNLNDDVNETDGEDELDDSENVEMESNYDVEELIQQYSLNNELEGNTL